MERFGEKLRIVRKQRGLTQEQLGEVLGVARFFTVTADPLMMDELEIN